MLGTAYTTGLRKGTLERRTLGAYRLLEMLGENALDAVHLARLDGAHGFPRWVALRVFEGRGSVDGARVRQLCEEARAAASVVHPNLMTVLDVGQSDGVWWVATEYLLGESAHEILRQAEHAVVPVPWAIATRIVADAADALAAMHARRGARGETVGVAPGSLSPRSLFVTYAGTTKLKALRTATRDHSADPRDAAYLPPLGDGAHAVDAPADVYALAAILWELCAGRHIEVWDAHARRETPSLTRLAGAPESLDTIIQRALGALGGAPCDTARELARALRGVLVVEGVVVEEHDVARYVQSRFAERHTRREAQLRNADSELPELFRAAAIDAPDTVRELPSSDDDDDDDAVDQTLIFRKRDLPAQIRSFVKAQPVIVIGPDAGPPWPSSMFAPPSAIAAFASGSSLGAPAVVSPTVPATAAPPFLLPLLAAPELAASDHAAPDLAVPRLAVPRLAVPAPRAFAPTPAVAINLLPRAERRPRRPGVVAAVLFVAVAACVLFFFARDPRVLASLRQRLHRAHPAAAILVASAAPPAPAPPAPTVSSDAPPESIAVDALPVSSVTVPSAPAASSAPLPVASGASANPPTPAPKPITPARAHGVAATPPHAAGTLTVVCDPACDDVLDEGRSLGASPIFKAPVSVGVHHLTLVIAGPSIEKQVTVTVDEDQTALVREEME